MGVKDYRLQNRKMSDMDPVFTPWGSRIFRVDQLGTSLEQLTQLTIVVNS